MPQRYEMPMTDVMNYTSLSTTTIAPDTSLPEQIITNSRELQTWRRAQVLHLAPVIVLDVLVMLFGVIGNSVVCYVCLFRMQRTVINCFVLSLAAVELLGCIFIIPVDITELMNSYAFDYPILCKTEKYFRKVVIFSTGCILVAIALERYKRIVKPHGRHVTLAQFRVAIVLSLIISVILAVPEAVLAGSETIQTPYGMGVVCSVYQSDQYRHTIYPKIWGVVVVFLYVFSIAAIGITYFVIASKIWKRGKVHTDRRSRPNTPDSTLQRRVKRFPNRTVEENGFMNGTAEKSPSYLQSFQRSLNSNCQTQTRSNNSLNSNMRCDHSQGKNLPTPTTSNKPNQYYQLDIHKSNASIESDKPENNCNNHCQCYSVNNNGEVSNKFDDVAKADNENDDNDKDIGGNGCNDHLLHSNHFDDSSVTEVESLLNEEEHENKDKEQKAEEQHGLPTIKIDDEYIQTKHCDKCPSSPSTEQNDKYLQIENDDNICLGLPTIREDDKYFQLTDDKFPFHVDLHITSKDNDEQCLSDEDSGFPSNSGNHEDEDHDLQLRHNTMESQSSRHQENRPTVFFSELIKNLSTRRLESFSHGRRRYSPEEHNNCDTLHRFHSSLTPMGSFRRKSTYSRKRTTFIMFIMTLTTALSFVPHISVMLYSLTRPGVEATLSPDVSVIFRIAWNSFFVSLASHPFVYGFWNGRFKHALYGLLLGIRRLRHKTDRESLSSARSRHS